MWFLLLQECERANKYNQYFDRNVKIVVGLKHLGRRQLDLRIGANDKDLLESICYVRVREMRSFGLYGCVDCNGRDL